MTGFRDVQDTLDRILGEKPFTNLNHGAFWRGLTRDQFVNMSILGFKLVTEGDPETSNLVLALRGLPPFGSNLVPRRPGAVIPRMPAGGRPPATEAQIALIEDWIRNGCPEYTRPLTIESLHLGRSAIILASDQRHVEYWRAVDYFFLPYLPSVSEETKLHVGRMHAKALGVWSNAFLDKNSPSIWSNFLQNTDTQESLKYLRMHQQRLILEFYEGNQAALFDSLWKFGGNLLPTDPQGPAFPEHTMNGVNDWFYWVPYLDATLRSRDISEMDLALARAWQIGIVADGLLRTDAGRPPDEKRMPIPDFNRQDPDLKSKVIAAFSQSNKNELLSGMLERARQWFS